MQYAERFVQEFRPASVVADDTELAHALRAGDDDAVRELVRRYGGPVFVTAVRVLGDRALADEATRQTFVHAWRGSDRFEPGSDFGPWLAAIARRCALDIGGRDQPGDDDSGATLADSRPMDLSVTEAETLWSVRRAIEALDHDERDVVRLAHLEGRSHSEIADLRGLSIGVINARSYRSHRRLVNRLGHLRDLQEEDPR